MTRLAELAERAGVTFCLDNLNAAGDLIGEIGVADVPGRCEPGTGEVHCPAIARARIGYTGTVGFEAYASGDDVGALERFRAAFR